MSGRRRECPAGKKQARRAGELRLAVDEKHALRRHFVSGLQSRAHHINIVARLVLDPRAQGVARNEQNEKVSLLAVS